MLVSLATLAASGIIALVPSIGTLLRHWCFKAIKGCQFSGDTFTVHLTTETGIIASGVDK